MGNTESDENNKSPKNEESSSNQQGTDANEVEITEKAEAEATELGLKDASTAYFSCYNSKKKFFQKVDEITIGGLKCTTFNDEHFARIRAHFEIPNDFAQSKDNFDFSSMAAAGGKGGDPMAKTVDKKYIIKEVNEEDHATLLELAQGLANHFIEKTEPSIIVPIFAHFTRTDKKSKKSFFAMTNCLTDPGPYFKIYDLKGCADDKLLTENGERVHEVHKRIWKLRLWFGCGGPDRQRYLQGKLEALHEPDIRLTKDQKDLLMNAIRSDCNFMKKYGLMDYSLLVAVIDKAGKSNVAENTKTLTEIRAGIPLVSDDGNGTQRVTLVGIIDFLQQWKLGKKVAQGIKVLERNKATIPPPRYADRFVKHFERRILIVDGDSGLEKQINDRAIMKLPHRCYPFLRK